MNRLIILIIITCGCAVTSATNGTIKGVKSWTKYYSTEWKFGLYYPKSYKVTQYSRTKNDKTFYSASLINIYPPKIQKTEFPSRISINISRQPHHVNNKIIYSNLKNYIKNNGKNYIETPFAKPPIFKMDKINGIDVARWSGVSEGPPFHALLFLAEDNDIITIYYGRNKDDKEIVDTLFR